MRKWPITAAAFLLVGTLAACGTSAASSPGAAKLYPLPTSSWRPGDPSLHALTIGTRAAGPYRGRWCVWLVGPGSRRFPIVWPAGFRARRRPLELVDSRGTVVARGGERIELGGGVAPVSHRPCMLGQREAFYAMSYPGRVRQHDGRPGRPACRAARNTLEITTPAFGCPKWAAAARTNCSDAPASLLRRRERGVRQFRRRGT